MGKLVGPCVCNNFTLAIYKMFKEDMNFYQIAVFFPKSPTNTHKKQKKEEFVTIHTLGQML